MASMGFGSSPLSAPSLVKLRTNSKYHPSSWVPTPKNVHASYKISLESSKSSFIQDHDGFFSSLQNFSRLSSILSVSSNIITAQKSPLGGPTVYEFTAKQKGKRVRLSKFRAKVLLIVNIPEQGSELTNSQYTFLNGLYAQYKSQEFEILGFLYDKNETSTSTNRGGKKQIATPEFSIFDKVKLNGKHADPLWHFLKNSLDGEDVEDEFEKFLVDREGHPVRRYPCFPGEGEGLPAQPMQQPSLQRLDPRTPLRNDIEKFLRE